MQGIAALVETAEEASMIGGLIGSRAMRQAIHDLLVNVPTGLIQHLTTPKPKLTAIQATASTMAQYLAWDVAAVASFCRALCEEANMRGDDLDLRDPTEATS